MPKEAAVVVPGKLKIKGSTLPTVSATKGSAKKQYALKSCAKSVSFICTESVFVGNRRRLLNCHQLNNFCQQMV